MAISHSSRSGTSDLIRASQSFLPMLDLVAEALDRRRIRRSYGKMSDEQLRDIGLVPHDVVAALSLPMEQSAEDALARAAAQEASRW